jgi:DNA-binding NarL/FixJ family response regulator
MIRVLVVHRVRLTCDLIAAALRDEVNIAVVEHAQSADEALAKTQRHSFDVALVNINLPDNDALRFTRAITRSKKALKVVITGLVQSKAAVLRCVEEGAAGYVLEEDSLPDLVKKIHSVYANEFTVAPNIAGALIARLAELKRKVTTIRTLAASESFNEPAELTTREWEILCLIERGLSNQEIADTLVIELGTVKNHVHNILRKLDVENRKHAVIFAREMLSKRLVGKPAVRPPVQARPEAVPAINPAVRFGKPMNQFVTA